MASPKQNDVIAELRALVNGIQSNLPTTTLTVAGKSLPPAQLLAFVQSCLASLTTVQAARGALTDAIVADRAFQAQNQATLKAIRSMIALMFVDNVSKLAEFGLTPPKERAPLSAEALLSRAAKSRATRAKRRTMGKRQKAAIKGDVTGVVISPTTTDGDSCRGCA